MALSLALDCPQVWPGVGRRFSFEILLRIVVLRLSGGRSELALARRPGAANREGRAACLAPPRLAQPGQGHALGRRLRVRFLFCPLLERADGFLQRHSALSRVAIAAAVAHATVEVLARSGGVRLKRREPTNLHSGPHVFPWRLVLFSGAVCLEVAAGVSSFAPFRGGDCLPLERPFRRKSIRHPQRHGTALARAVGLAGGLRGRVHAESAGPQHSSFLHRAGAADSSARPAARHVGVAAALELARRARGKMGDHRPRGCLRGHRRVGLSTLFSLPERAQQGTAGLPPGE